MNNPLLVDGLPSKHIWSWWFSSDVPMFVVTSQDHSQCAGNRCWCPGRSNPEIILGRKKISRAKCRQSIKALYEHPFFKTIHNTEESEWKKQHSGIRQGCPLSPYLFILMMNGTFCFSMWGARTMMHFFQKTVNNMTFQELCTQTTL